MLANFRDVGGMQGAGGSTIVPGRLFRCQQLADGSAEDLVQLADLGIGLVVDFRSNAERTERPDNEVADACNMHLPIFDEVRLGITRGKAGNKSIADSLKNGTLSVADVDVHMQQMYAGFVQDSFSRKQYAAFIDAVLEQGLQQRGSLWHCTAGKDRAGFGTVVVLELLGVSRESIMADYLLSNERLEGTVDSLLDMLHAEMPEGASLDSLRQYFRVDESYLNAAYAAAEESYGSFSAFLEQGLGISSEKHHQFQETFLV